MRTSGACTNQCEGRRFFNAEIAVRELMAPTMPCASSHYFARQWWSECEILTFTLRLWHARMAKDRALERKLTTFRTKQEAVRHQHQPKSEMATSSSKPTTAVLILLLLVVSQNFHLQMMMTTTFLSAHTGVFPPENSPAVKTMVLQQQPQDRLHKYFQTYRYILPVTRYQPIPAIECGNPANFEAFFKLGHEVRSRLDEDKFIYESFFKNKMSSDTVGNYVELGAFNGRTESNTRFFDVCLGWKGLLIEGNPDSYERVVAHRPFAHKMSLAPSCSAEYERVNRTVPFYRFQMPDTGMADRAVTYLGQPTIEVPCGPLGPILQDVFGVDTAAKPVSLGEIHFFSLDVEGAERLVLDTIDFTRIFIHVLMIEIQNKNCPGNAPCQVRTDVRKRMQDVGYLRYEGVVPASDVYVHPASPFQMPAHLGHRSAAMQA